MHDDRELVERRIRRELWERVLPMVHVDRRPLAIMAGPAHDQLDAFAVGDAWGPPWATTWFRLDGEVPDDWPARRAARIEALIDLGFTRDPPGFQCEGLVIELNEDGAPVPLQGIHPRRTMYPLPARETGGPVSLLVEAASNPTFRQFRPSPDGAPATAGTDPRARFRAAELVLVDVATEALVHDLFVLDDLMRTLAVDDPRRDRLRARLAAALDRVPDVAAARRTLAAELAPLGLGTDRRHRIVATGHAHIDTAWLWPTRETQRKCARTFASALGLMDDHPEYRFSASSAQHYAWIEQRHPALFAAIAERVREGRWLPVGGMWVEADMNLPSAESLARQIVHGQRYFAEKFGAPCTEVWIPDVFGYPAGLPQLFAAGGMHRFVTQKLSWNKQNRFPHHTFMWEGLDGTQVLTHFPPVDTYNAQLEAHEVVASLRNFNEHAWSTASLMPFGHGDGGGGPTREMLEQARRLADVDPRWTLEIGSADDFFRHVEREIARGAPVPVWRGELYFETHRGTLTSQLRTKLGNRRCERLLVEAELWAATSGDPTAGDGLDERWREVLTQQFHDILPGSSIAWVHADAEEVFERVGAELDRRIADQLERLVPLGERWLTNSADVAIDGVVVLPGDPPVDGGQQLADGSVAVRVAVPALGAAPLVARDEPDRVVVGESTMANGSITVRWDPVGNLTSIIDIVRRRELLPTGGGGAVLELAPDHPVEYNAWDLEAWTRRLGQPIAGRTDVESVVTVADHGPLVGRVTAEHRFGPSSALVTYELRAGEPQLFVHVELDWHHDEHLLSIAFPLDVRADTAACDVQLGIVRRPTHPSSPWDAAKYEVCAHRFVDVSEPDFGVAVLNDGRYGHCVFDGAIRVSLARAAKYPDPDADHGRHSVTLALLPHGAGLADVRAGASRLNGVVRVVDGRGTDPVGPERPLIEIDGHGVEVDAVKPADDGSGDVVVRLHEALGNRVRIAVRARRRIGGASRCDLLERDVAGEEVTDGIVATTLRPFELVTLRLRFVDDFDGR